MTLAIHLPYSKKDHRADIGGMRAIAVLPIVLFHAFPEQLTGGYIGVDIFLVISGFLITQIWIEPQPIFTVHRFKDFYVCRIKRIFPALLLTGFASAAVAFFSPLRGLWEFMAGGLMAAAVSHNRFVPRQTMTADLVSVLRMVLIIMPAVFVALVFAVICANIEWQ